MARVFHLISHFDVGGAERVAVSIAKDRHEGVEQHVVELLRANTPYTPVFISELKSYGIKYHRSFIPELHFHYMFERLAAILFPLRFIFLYLKYRPTAIHCHTEMPDLAVCLFFKLFPFASKHTKVVRTIHNTRLWTGMKSTGKKVEKFMMSRGCNISISEAVHDNYLKEYGQDTPIIYNGVGVTPQKPFGGIKNGRINILFAGRMEPQKGIKTLCEVIKMLEGDSRYHFHVMGDGSLRTFAEQSIGNNVNVSLYRPVHGLSAYLSSFDYLFMPSEFEGLSIMAIEAGMESLPVIANDCPGLRDTLPPDWPLKVSDNSIGEYEKLFADVIPHTDARQAGANLHAFAAERFGLKQMQLRYIAVYNS